MENDKNLVIMYIEGSNYDFNGIKVTIQSLREHYSGEITIIINNVDSKLIEYLGNYNVNLVNSEEFTVLFKTSPFNNKIIYIYLFLKEYSERYKDYNVFYNDITDVYFSCDPFSLQKNKLWFSVEDKCFKNCETNSTWSDICYNSFTTKELSDCRVINSGLILGTFEQMFNLYKLMTDEMSVILGKVNYPITDQIIVNKLIRLDNLDCYISYTEVNHLAQLIKTTFGDKITHQYKCVPSLKEELYKKYA